MDKVIDPILIYNDEIIKFIKEQKLISETEIIGTLTELDNETLKKWATQENLKTNKIVMFSANDGETYYIDGLNFINMISEYNQLILYQSEKMNELSLIERRKINTRMELLYQASLHLLKIDGRIQEFAHISNENLQVLKKILDEYEKYKNKIKVKENQNVPKRTKRKKSIFRIIIEFFKSLFKFYAKGEADSLDEETREKIFQRKELSSETTRIYRKTVDRNAPIIPLSDFVELTPDNDYLLDRIIKELRDHNLKIVIPIYNARKNLYPKRSQKLLIPDMEYLLVSTDIAKTPGLIREFTDSLVGHKIKDEIIPATAIIAIEKYLMTLYRQSKSGKAFRS